MYLRTKFIPTGLFLLFLSFPQDRAFAFQLPGNDNIRTTIISPEFSTSKSRFPGFFLNKRVKKPRIALVLSGGGARGIASIGVLKVLEQNEIPIDLIVGTSIGSIVGGLYATGYSTEQLHRLADTTNWEDVLSYNDEARRRDLFLDQKLASDRSILILRFNGLEPIIPSSYSTGQRLTNYLSILTLQGIYHPNPSFDDLRIPFRAVTTDLITGKQVVIDSGDLAEALRASVTVPLLFSTVKKDSMELLDGGLLANMPVDIARQNGADIVVTVDVTSPLRPATMLNAPWEIGEQIMGIMMQTANQTAREKSDVVITPALGNHLSSDFSDPDTLIRRGEEAAESVVLRLKKLFNDRAKLGVGSTGSKVFANPKFVFKGDFVGREFVERMAEYEGRKLMSEFEVRGLLTDLYEEGEYESVQGIIQEKSDQSLIEFRINPNPVVKSVDVSGNRFVGRDTLLAIVRPLVGKRLNQPHFNRALEDMLSVYRDAGYSLARIRDVRFDAESGNASIVLDEGEIFRIEIKGTKKTKDYIIWRELPWTEGDVFQVSKVAQGITNLYSTSLFEQVSATVHQEGPNGEYQVVVINARERSVELIRFGLRIDNERNFQPSVDVRDENFLGIGAELGTRFFGGSRNQTYLLEFKATRIFNSYLTFGLKGLYSSRDVNVFANEPSDDPLHFNRARVGEFREVRNGASVSFGTQLERLGSVTIQGRLENHKIQNIFNQPVPDEEYGISSIMLGTRVDTKDKFPFATDGVVMDFSYESALVKVINAVGYTKLMFSYEKYQSLAKRHTIHAKVVLGLADETLPLSEQFSLGGQETFFGFREDNARGRQLFLLSLEYQYQLPLKILFDTYLKARYDFGSIWARPEEIRFIDLQHGLGIGVAFDTPIGPAEFSVGRSFYLRKDLLERPLSLGALVGYFSIGYAF